MTPGVLNTLFDCKLVGINRSTTPRSDRLGINKMAEACIAVGDIPLFQCILDRYPLWEIVNPLIDMAVTIDSSLLEKTRMLRALMLQLSWNNMASYILRLDDTPLTLHLEWRKHYDLRFAPCDKSLSVNGQHYFARKFIKKWKWLYSQIENVRKSYAQLSRMAVAWMTGVMNNRGEMVAPSSMRLIITDRVLAKLSASVDTMTFTSKLGVDLLLQHMGILRDHRVAHWSLVRKNASSHSCTKTMYLFAHGLVEGSFDRIGLKRLAESAVHHCSLDWIAALLSYKKLPRPVGKRLAKTIFVKRDRVMREHQGEAEQEAMILAELVVTLCGYDRSKAARSADNGPKMASTMLLAAMVVLKMMPMAFAERFMKSGNMVFRSVSADPAISDAIARGTPAFKRHLYGLNRMFVKNHWASKEQRERWATFMMCARRGIATIVEGKPAQLALPDGVADHVIHLWPPTPLVLSCRLNCKFDV